MATSVIMPRQGQSVESCIIAKWHKKKGDRVEAGDILFSYETDKASFDEEAKVEGVMLEIFFEEGDDVPCLTNVCVIGKEGESVEEFRPRDASGGQVTAGLSPNGTAGGQAPVNVVSAAAFIPSMTSGEQSGKAAAYKAAAVQPGEGEISGAGVTGLQNQHKTTQAHSNITGEVIISPRAKKLAEKAGIDYRYATPSGPYGRIIERDIAALRESGMVFTSSAIEEQMKGRARQFNVNAYASVAGSGLGGRITTADLAGAETEVNQAYEEVRIPNIRKVIARTMHQSLSSMAQLTLNSSFDISDILDFRKKLKESREKLGLANITINDIIIYAVSRTLPNHKELNAHFLDDRMLCFKNVNVGIAVDTERGLIVPTLFNAGMMSLDEISAEVKRLVKDCQSGIINPDVLRNGTFTVTNLGTLDVESFTPVINPPQTGILGVNNIVQRAREVNGEYEFYPAMGLSLTFDHRALDGAPAARFLKELKTNLESFSALLAKA